MKPNNSKLIFHNVKNNFWNFFTLQIDAKQNLIVYSSDDDFFKNFIKILTDSRWNQGFVIDEGEIIERGNQSTFYHFLTKGKFDEYKDQIIHNVLINFWKPDNSYKKYDSELISFAMIESHKILVQLLLDLKSFKNKNINFDEFLNKIVFIRNKYEFFHKNFSYLFNFKQKLWTSTPLKSELEIIKKKRRERIREIRENSHKKRIFLKNFTNNIKEIIRESKKNIIKNDEDNLQIQKIFIVGFKLFLKSLKENKLVKSLEIEQVLTLYGEFEKWIHKATNKRELNNEIRVADYFNRYFKQYMINFVREKRAQKKDLNKKNKIEAEIFNKNKKNFEKNNPFYKRMYLNEKNKLHAEIVWDHELTKEKKKLQKTNTYFLKYHILSLVFQIKHIINHKTIFTDVNIENFDFLTFIKVLLNDFISLLNLNFLGFKNFINKNLFYNECLNNNTNFSQLFNIYSSLSVEDMFNLEFLKTKLKKYRRVVFNCKDFFFEPKYANMLISKLIKDYNKTQIIIFCDKPVEPVKGIAMLFVEKGTLIEYNPQVDLPLKLQTNYAKNFYENFTFDTNQLDNIHLDLYKQIQKQSFLVKENYTINTFEKFKFDWKPIVKEDGQNTQKQTENNNNSKKIEDVLVIDI
ncbi:Uncharacterised protein [Mesomycoplasma conjunctivae]|uniref:Uncharacterized protein n=1 Tax=Mesomycoplasma conjunctivae (strain ATCC 25834 / NCTC 10147 / HRC/581) TaxID=572263 RepID=C5J7E7_MESCH|nr:hypothetical protein [Mesomycoplasma conjunctivae]CAT05410.1 HYPOTHETICAL PROTEIN MCJ_007280 [Mesomycoplasma conjunctivae]VEU66635.1 Uncharacterised protein [Mesomycoplasma conjunctivae]